MTPLQKIAAAYIERGWCPIPVNFRSKSPINKDWQNLHLSKEDVPRYFNGQDQNVGVLLGALSGGLTDIDLDAPEAVASADRFLPGTGSVFGRRSKPRSHRLYSTTITEPIKLTDVDGTCLLEIRAKDDGGIQTVFPPSTHADGELIEWVSDGEPAKVDDDTLRSSVHRLAACASLARHWPGVGSRHDAHLALIGGLARAGWSEAAISNFVSAMCDTTGATRDGRKKHLAAVSSTLKKVSDGRRVWGWPKLAEHVGREVVAKVCEWLGIGAANESDDAHEFDVPEWPVLNGDALHGVVGEAVHLICAESEVDPAAALATLLTSLGAVIGNGTDRFERGPYYQIGETRHHPCLFAALVGATSRSRKGTSSAYAARITNAAEAKLPDLEGFGEYEPVRVTPGPLSSGEGVVWNLRDPSEEMTKDSDGNDTDEPVDEGVTDKRLLLVDGELGSAFTVMQRDGNTVSVIVRQAWDGAPIEPLTKNNRIRATDPHLCIVGHITRDELIELISGRELRNGFANRFLWLCVRRPKRVPFPAVLDGDAVSELAAKIAGAVAKARTLERINLATDARDLWLASYDQLTDERPGNWGAATSRAEGQVSRLALLYALLDGDDAIRAAHLQAALAVWDYCDASARYLFGNPAADKHGAAVLEALADGPLPQTELHRRAAKSLDGKKFAELLRGLQELGRIVGTKEPSDGGRPRVVWRRVR